MCRWNKRILLLFLLIPVAPFLPAHEFWLQPEKFICERGETINIRFNVGENFEGANWNGNAARINSLRLYMDKANDDLAPQISENNGDSLQLAMFDEGTAMVTFNSTNAFITLEPSEFNDYLKEDGLINAVTYRQKKHETNKPGKEFYQRSVKTLVQVGSKTNNCFKQATDLPLDIIPQTNPYFLKNNEPLVVKVYHNKKPLINYDIRLWQRLHDTTLQQRIKTNQKGEFSFKVNTTGKWMVSTVVMTRVRDDPKVEWQSYWGSLTWGY